MMIDEKKIERIVHEIIKQKTRNHAKSKLLLYNNSDSNNDKLHLLSEKWDIIQFTDEMDEVPIVEKVIFLDASQDLFVKGALGITDTTESKLLAEAIRLNLHVQMVPSTDFDWFLQVIDKNKVSNYEKQLLNYRANLKKFGVQLIDWRTLLSIKLHHKNSEQSAPNFYDKLLTQQAIENMQSDEVIITQSTIVTPLAKDAAKELGKEIYKIDLKEEKI